MTKKDFETIAKIITTMPNNGRVAEHFADALAAENPKFKRDVFIKACHVRHTVYRADGVAVNVTIPEN